MTDTVIVAIISLLGTLLGSFGGTQLVKYRIEQLEKKVEKHNSIVERTYILEEKVKVANHRIEDLERKDYELCKTRIDCSSSGAVFYRDGIKTCTGSKR
jgi:hypothetical protein